MNSINKAFSSGKVFIPFITGGDPDMETTGKIIYALHESGADIIGIGIPFSDPIAEGPVIEASDERALKAGCTVDKLFDLVESMQGDISVPMIFLTYYNPVFAYGVEKFTKRCAACGIRGLIVPDLPFEERDELLKPCEAEGINLISLIAPASADRITRIAKHSEGFLYCVSLTGVHDVEDFSVSPREMVARVKEVSSIPCAVEFGISTPEQAREAAVYADGVIVGSAMVQLIAEHGRECVPYVKTFAGRMKEMVGR